MRINPTVIPAAIPAINTPSTVKRRLILVRATASSAFVDIDLPRNGSRCEECAGAG